MNLLDVFRRDMSPEPWVEGEKIPWDEPAFSKRMLKEHLSQRHDAASRRTGTLKKHVDWIHRSVLATKPSRILDLGCGPGLYCARLAAFGHVCHGIDFSPASVDYAVEHAPEGCTYTLGDLRTTDFGSGYDLVMLVFGEFNVFKTEDAKLILDKAFRALNPGGKLLLEVTTYDAVYELGDQPATWYSAENELFADEPHFCLMESFWVEEQSVAIERYYIVDATTGQVTRHSASTQAYENDELAKLLVQAGFQAPVFSPSLTGKPAAINEMIVLLSLRQETL